jgi:Mg-chelatase subunit ChlD
MGVVFVVLLASTPLAATAPHAPQAALPKPKNIICQGWERDTVVVSWTDEAPDETQWRVERNIGGAGWSQVAALAANSGEWRDTVADVSTQNRRYRVRSFRSGDSASSPYSDICNNRRIYENGPFRIFYGLRGTSDDCPLIGTQEACTANLSFVDLQGQSLQGSRAGFSRVGFLQDAGVPFGSLDKIPINVVWCDGGGCAGGGGLGLSPYLIEMPFDRTTRLGDPAPYIVAEHELFHFLQGRYGGLSEPNDRWVIEGQARSTQDKICLGSVRSTAWCFDDIDTGYAGYVPEVNGYLGNPNVGIRVSSYGAALFWTYLTEKYGTNLTSDQVEGRMNLMVKFWEDSAATPGRDAVAVLNSALSTLGFPSANYKSIFKDFIIANVAKDLNGPGVPAKYKYADMAQPGGNYAQVMYTISQTLALGGSFLDTDETVNPWGARYYQFRPASNVPVIPIKITQDTLTPVFYVVLGIKGDTIAYEQRYEQRNLDVTLINDAYERVVVIVAGLDNLGNYRISLNGTQPVLNILSPTTGNKARVGAPSAPDKFLAQIEVVAGDGTPLAGINLNNFRFKIGSRNVPTTNIVASSVIQGQQWFVIQAVTQTSATAYDLTARYSTIVTGTQSLAINYIPRTDADNVLVIDTSGSMGNYGKMDSAKQAGRLYVDSWRTGDKIAVESFNSTASVNLTLRNWTDSPGGGSRLQAFNIITGFVAGGATAIGDALLAGWDELKARGVATHDWALILLSDGEETAGVKTFDTAVSTIHDSTAKKPVIHTVAVGPDADRLRMQNAANATGGTYQYVSAPADPSMLAPGAPADDVIMMPLNLDSKYRAIATAVLGHQQFFSLFGPVDPRAQIEFTNIPVEGNASELVISISWLPDMYAVQLTDPLSNTVTAFESDLRHTVWRVSTPTQGTWRLIVYGSNKAGTGTTLPPYFVHGSLKSRVTLNAFIDTPLSDRVPGAPEHILALLTDNKAILGASIIAEVTRPDAGVNTITLYDDGAHGDGAANDGVYGQNFYNTGLAGSYGVLVKADGVSALAGAFHREALLAFALIGTHADTDQDRLPDEWELQFPCVIVGKNDAGADPDHDGLSNYQEYLRGTDPCNPDTDGDGEADGTDKNPTEPDSGRINPPWSVVWPGIGRTWLKYVVLPTYQRIEIYRRLISPTLATVVALGPATPGADDVLIGTDEPPTGVFTDTTPVNGQTYCYYAVAVGTDGQRSTALSPTCTTPKADPVPPHGGLNINNGSTSTPGPNVTLNLIAADTIDPHNDGEYGDSFMTPPTDSASGVADMMISNRSDMQGGVWQTYATTKPWTLNKTMGLASVFVKYRDVAGNESAVYAATIHVGLGSPGLHAVYLPVIRR